MSTILFPIIHSYFYAYPHPVTLLFLLLIFIQFPFSSFYSFSFLSCQIMPSMATVLRLCRSFSCMWTQVLAHLISPVQIQGLLPVRRLSFTVRFKIRRFRSTSWKKQISSTAAGSTQCSSTGGLPWCIAILAWSATLALVAGIAAAVFCSLLFWLF